MKSRLLLLIFFVSTLFGSLLPMKDEEWATFKEMPVEIKLTIINKILESPSLIKITNALTNLKRVDKELYAIVSNEKRYEPFFELQKLVNTEDNAFKIFKFLDANRQFLQYRDLAVYLQSKKLSYLPIQAIQSALDLTNPEEFKEFKKNLTTKSLYDAIESQDIAQVFCLLLVGMDPNQKFRLPTDLWSPLSGAIDKQNYAIVKLLLDKGAIVRNEPIASLNPLTVAVRKQNPAIVRLLLQYRADPDAFGRRAALNNPFSKCNSITKPSYH